MARLHDVPVTTGSYSARDWLFERGLDPGGRARWYVELSMGVGDGPVSQLYSASTESRFQINIYPEEWSYFFCHAGRTSWIRIIHTPVIHERDDFDLLHTTPLLRDIGGFVRGLEACHAIAFRRDCALIRTNLDASRASFASWLASL